MTITWGVQQTMYDETSFDKLNIGDCFVITSSRSKGTPYMKVTMRDHVAHRDVPYMLELTVGKVWPPPKGKVRKIDVNINIGAV